MFEDRNQNHGGFEIRPIIVEYERKRGMQEIQFSIVRIESSYQFRDMTDISEAYSFETWIGYRDDLKRIEGYVLKQKAELTLDEESIDAFCDFLNRNIIDY